MASSIVSSSWLWHPHWTEKRDNAAGAFVHFRKQVVLVQVPEGPTFLQISADTKYKLYINSQFVCYGPVKGDEELWFYDEVDIQPYLRPGTNHISVRVLRLYHATQCATTFSRTISPGLCVNFPEVIQTPHASQSSSWETALDLSTSLPTGVLEDDFLHIYECVDNSKCPTLVWVDACPLPFPRSHGLAPPWKLSPRLIPFPRHTPALLKSIHRCESTLPLDSWSRVLLGGRYDNEVNSVKLPAGTTHYVEVEAESHLVAFINFRFSRPEQPGSCLRVKYSECYEDKPIQIPYLRSKQDRCDNTKSLYGPEDSYIFGGMHAQPMAIQLKHDTPLSEEAFDPYHYRTFRFLTLEITVSPLSDLILKGVNITRTHYPLDIQASINLSSSVDPTYTRIWLTSLRTLQNCMHDTYQDCPFYEQLQYAMDTRSSILFTYAISSDDRLARQAIIQLHNSYRADTGLTASRAPAHQRQLIPHFSLFWVCMVADHYEHFADASFVQGFVPAIDGVIEHFSRRIDTNTGLVSMSRDQTQGWDFVDWTESWRPMGIPPAASRTRYSTFTNMLYVYTLNLVVRMLFNIGRPGIANDYRERSHSLVKAIRKHCFDGHFFTDGLADLSNRSQEYSQHSQIWGILCGATAGTEASTILKQALSTSSTSTSIKFTPTSTAMSFYTLRALSLIDTIPLYDMHFHSFWDPWRAQLGQNLTTWEEDSVSQRSDCHAWGCAALYEFCREVAGIRMGSSIGAGIVVWKPRLALFGQADFVVPVWGVEGGGKGVAEVKWKEVGVAGDIHCEFIMRLTSNVVGVDGGRMPVIRVILPGREIEEILNGDEGIARVVRGTDVRK